MKNRTKPARRKGYTRLSAKGQVTIPKQAIIDRGWSAGDEFRIDIEDDRIVLTPMRGPDEQWQALVDEAASRRGFTRRTTATTFHSGRS